MRWPFLWRQGKWKAIVSRGQEQETFFSDITCLPQVVCRRNVLTV